MAVGPRAHRLADLGSVGSFTSTRPPAAWGRVVRICGNQRGTPCVQPGMKYNSSYVASPQIRALFAHARKLKADRLRAEAEIPSPIKIKSGSVFKSAICASCGGVVHATGDKGIWSHRAGGSS